ncbi:hypothetical protein ACIRS1_13930 [Kitasatospora sp. NPDC101176]|uniref:hypothetical protein n=1 Tax=Kitasatospora sp. NPDC101176 TaxID=3364099 RepID=UPI00382830D9
MAPGEWAAKIRAANPFDTTVRKLDACTAPETPSAQVFDGVDLVDIAGGPMGVYGVRRFDGSPVRFDSVGRRWNPIPGTGLPGGGLNRIAPGKDIVWGLRADRTVVYFDGTTWKADPQGFKGLGIACGPDGTLYIVGGDNSLWQRTLNTAWQPLNVPQADEVAVTSRGKVWYLRQGKTYERTETGWQELSPSPATVQRLSAGADGTLWASLADGRTALLPSGANRLGRHRQHCSRRQRRDDEGCLGRQRGCLAAAQRRCAGPEPQHRDDAA